MCSKIVLRIIVCAWLGILLYGFQAFAQPQTLRIAAAADLQQAMPELRKGFAQQRNAQKRPQVRLEAVYGSSGNFTTQIRQGAPFDLFFSADMRYPALLADAGLTTAQPRKYATGQMVMWVASKPLRSANVSQKTMNLHLLKNPLVQRIAIANPIHAPYGERAQEALQALGIWASIEHRLARADNVAQAAQFAATGNADAAIISLSQAMMPVLAQRGEYALIDKTLYKPLEQGAVVLLRSKDRTLAEEFLAYCCSPEGALVLKQFGFLP